MMLDGLEADCCSDVRLARAGASNQNDVVGVVEEVAAMKLLHEASLISLLAKSKPFSSR
jgi:hypothetical protein